MFPHGLGAAPFTFPIRERAPRTVINIGTFHVPDMEQTWQDVFRDFGHDLSLQEIRSQIGKGGDQLMPVFVIPEQLDGIGEKLENHRSKVMKERYLPRIEAFAQVRALFQRLKDD